MVDFNREKWKESSELGKARYFASVGDFTIVRL